MPGRRPAGRLQARSRPGQRLALRDVTRSSGRARSGAGKALGLRQRAVEFGLEIAGQEAVARGGTTSNGAKMRSKKALAPSRRRPDPSAARAGPLQAGDPAGSAVPQRRALRRRSPAQVRAEGAKAARVVVRAPSRRDPRRRAARAGRRRRPTGRRRRARPSRARQPRRRRPARARARPGSLRPLRSRRAASSGRGCRACARRSTRRSRRRPLRGCRRRRCRCASRVAVMSFERKRTVTWATRLPRPRRRRSRPCRSRRRWSRPSRRASRARRSRARNPRRHPATRRSFRRLAVALREGGDDHLVGGLGALDEAAGVEARLDARRSRRARPRPASPARRRRSSGPARARPSRRPAPFAAPGRRTTLSPLAGRGVGPRGGGGSRRENGSRRRLLAARSSGRAPSAAARSRRPRARER